MICGPKNSPLNFQPIIRSKSAGIKTKVEKEHSVNHSHCFLNPSFDSSRSTSNYRLKI
jgi:hypothetical protein